MRFMLRDFEWRRVGLLVQRGWTRDWRRLAPGAAVYAVLFTAVTTVIHPLGGVLFDLGLFLGLAYTAGAFAEIHDKLAAPLALQLPVSASEKIVARWILGALVYPLVVLAGTFLLHQFVYLIRTDILGPWLRSSGVFHVTANGHPVDVTATDWSLFPADPFPPVLVYLASQPLYLLGGLRFASAPTMKTLLVLGGGAAIYGIALLVLHNGAVILNDKLGHGAWNVDAVYGTLTACLRTAFWVLLPTLSILFSYRLLRGAQG